MPHLQPLPGGLGRMSTVIRAPPTVDECRNRFVILRIAVLTDALMAGLVVPVMTNTE